MSLTLTLFNLIILIQIRSFTQEVYQFDHCQILDRELTSF